MALPDAGGVLRTPRGYAVKARPDAGRAATLGTDLAALDAWVVAQGGQLRTRARRPQAACAPDAASRPRRPLPSASTCSPAARSTG